MRPIRTSLYLLALILTCQAQQPQYDLLLKGGHVIDPANEIDSVQDVAVSGDRIALVAKDIPGKTAKKVLDVTGLYVTPGLIDLHMHVYGYSGSLAPDSTALVAGTTTVVDCGGAGWRTFEEFKKKVIDTSRTRVLSFLNIVGKGMLGPAVENNVEDMDPEATAAKVKQYPGLIVGIKTAHFGRPGWTALERAVEAGRRSGTPVMVDSSILSDSGRTTAEKLLKIMRPGDIHTHLYNDRQLELVNRFNGKVQDYALAARKRGVLFDLGHGGGSFLWPVATKAMAQGFAPDTISTDLHTTSILMAQSDMPNCISKLMNLGMPLQDAIRRSTVSPARAISKYPELGTLSKGKTADIAVFDLKHGVFALKDSWSKKLMGATKLEGVLTIRNGDIVFDADGRGPSLSRSQLIYDLLLKGGEVIDPASKRRARLDVGIAGGKIVKVGANLNAAHARKTVNANGYYVTPGFIGAQTGVTPNTRYEALSNGVTTVVEAGTDSLKDLEAVTRLDKGMTLNRVIARATTIPARSIRRPELGTLKEGAVADVVLIELEGGTGSRRIRCSLTVLGGKVVWDREGLSLPDWSDAGPYSNYK